MKSCLLLPLFVSFLFYGCGKKTEHPDDEVIYSNDFSSDDGTWAGGCCRFNQGHYEVNEATAGHIEGSNVPAPLISTGFVMTADVSIVLDDPSRFGYGGLAYNFISNSNFKLFEISSRGYYQVVQTLNGTSTKLEDWTFSPLLKTGSGAMNTLEVAQHNASVDFLINGTIVLTLPDPHEYNLKLAFVAGATTDPDFTPVVVWFDNLTVKKSAD